MSWNWQQPDWPNFTCDFSRLAPLEAQFLHDSGVIKGAFTHLEPGEKATLTVEVLSHEAFSTSEIEGELLNRDSIQSSIRRFFALSTDSRRIPAAEYGVSEMITHLYRTYPEPLSHESLFHWHSMLTNGRRDLQQIGAYRIHAEPMQIISGRLDEATIHYEAPPSHLIPKEMDRFVTWWNETGPTGTAPLPALTRAGLSHLYFECIHPFEDGNGRIGRTLAEKTVAHSIGHPVLLSLSRQIQKNRKGYYTALESNNQSLEITSWLVYFAQILLEAQHYTHKMLVFWVEKAKFFRQAQGQLNERQEKVLARIFREGLEGFQGGLSAENYIQIAKTSRATATRDLQDLVEKKLLCRSGEKKGTRYKVMLPSL